VALLAVQGELDTLFLGLFRSAEEVGAYRIYALFDRTFALVALSLAAIYKPVVAGLAATGRIEEIGELYQRVARWLFAINTLGLLVMFLLGQAIIGHLFTSRYLICYPALLIMLSGRFLNGSFGLEGVSLEALGHTRLLLLNMVILVSAKSALNYLLVPGLGMMGAALASALALVAAGLAGLIELYVLYGLQPYGLRHLKYAGSGLVLGLAAHGALRGLPPPGPGQTLAWVAALGAGYILSAYASGSLDAQDRLVLSRIKTKLWKAHPAA
jgi:O-antigen/teichoic acid export membrane protein